MIPVFVIQSQKYDSYTDYWRLVAASGFETCHQDDVATNRNCAYIISPTNGNIEAMLAARPRPRNARFILWFLERPGPDLGRFRQTIAAYLSDYGLDQVWFSDRAMHNLVSDIAGAKFVPMGSDESIGTPEKGDYYFDITHMSYVWGRRSFLDHPKLMRVHNNRLGGNCWGEQRDHVLKTSKFMVNVHQDSGEFHEPLRFALCSAYAIPMISERCIDPFPYEAGRDFMAVPYDELPQFIGDAITADYSGYLSYGTNMWETATKRFRFKNNVEQALT